MVNQVSKLPTLEQEQVVQLQVDGHGRRQTAFDLGGANSDENVLWRLVGLYGDGATQIKHTDHEQWFIAPSATMYFNDHATRLTLHGLYQKDRGGSTFQFLPYQGTVCLLYTSPAAVPGCAGPDHPIQVGKAAGFA